MIVIDACVAIKWGVSENLREQAMAVLRRASHLAAPDLIYPEIANICWQKILRKEIDAAQAPLVVATVREALHDVLPSADHVERAIEIAVELGHPAYDCVYLACAERLGGVLVSADRKFVRKAVEGGFAASVIALADPRLEVILAQEDG